MLEKMYHFEKAEGAAVTCLCAGGNMPYRIAGIQQNDKGG